MALAYGGVPPAPGDPPRAGAVAFLSPRARTCAGSGRLKSCAPMKLLGFLLAALPLSCAAAIRGGVSYEGREVPRVRAPEGLEEQRALPMTHRQLGVVVATCTLTPFDSAQGARLADLDCRESRLRAAVRERAAAAGGELLVGLDCSSQPLGAKGVDHRRRMTCRADVARARPARRTATRGVEVAAERERTRAAAATEAWSIRVDFTPAAGLGPRSPRHVSAVRERAEIPASHVRLGDIITRCARDCSEQGAFEGLFAVAARAGASELAEVSCVARGEGWQCSGVAVGQRVDPATDPDAR